MFFLCVCVCRILSECRQQCQVYVDLFVLIIGFTDSCSFIYNYYNLFYSYNL